MIWKSHLSDICGHCISLLPSCYFHCCLGLILSVWIVLYSHMKSVGSHQLTPIMDTWSDVLILLFTLPRNWWLFGHAGPCYCVSYLLLFSLLSVSHAYLRGLVVWCLRSSAAGRGIIFSLSFVALFFTSPTLNPLSYSFSAQCTGKPHYLYPPSALVLAFSRLPSCSRSIKPLDRERTSTLPQDLNLVCELNFSEIVLSTAVNIIEDFQTKTSWVL